MARPKPILPAVPHLEHELALHEAGHTFVAGVDEAGRGAWAGPVVAGAVILPIGQKTLRQLVGVNDSKKLSSQRREALRSTIEKAALAYGIGLATNSEIDALGIVPATRLAMTRAIQALLIAPDALIIDAVRLSQMALPQRVFNFADAISLSVAAASIVAKTARDALMGQMDATYPGYSFAAHKGYGTAAHAVALRALGPCPIHRFSFKPIEFSSQQFNTLRGCLTIHP